MDLNIRLCFRRDDLIRVDNVLTVYLKVRFVLDVLDVYLKFRI